MPSRKRLAAVALVAVSAALALPALAQAPPAAKPGPEHERLGYFVGRWVAEGTMAPSPFGPAGKMSAKEDCDWFEGHFAIVCRALGTGHGTEAKSLSIMTYSPQEKVYTYYGVDSSGMAMTSVPRGTLSGDTWTYEDETAVGEKKIRSRFTLTVRSPKAYDFKWEMADEKGGWVTVSSGTSTRAE